MSEQKHTPGPWEVSERLNAQDFDAEAANVLLIKGRRWDIAYAAHLASNGNPAEQEANARLIAAAPEMFEWLEKVVRIDGALISGELIAIQALIDKVTGR